MPLVSTPALVLQVYPYSESSKILRLLTAQLGVCSVIAKGAQRPRSRFGGLLEPFTEGEAQIFFREERDLHPLSGFDLGRSRQALGQDLVAFAGASLIAELVLRSATAEAQPRLFRLVSTALDRIVAAPTGLLQEVVVADVWLVVSLLGYRPQTDVCITCGTPLPTGDTARFDVEGGGVACGACRPHGRPLDPDSRRELEAMVEGRPVSAPFTNPTLQRALLRAFLTTHPARDFPLRSLDLFLQQLQA